MPPPDPSPTGRPGARLLAVTLVVAVGLAACGGGGGDGDAGAPDTPAQGWSFPDGHGGTVELDAAPKVIAAQSVVAGALWELGIVADGVFGPLRRADGTPDPAIGLADPDELESLGEIDSEINIEQLAVLKPDIIVTAMWTDDLYQGIDDAEVDQIRQIAPIVGIRVDDRPVTEPIAQIAKLAESVGAKPARVAESRREFQAASTQLERALAKKPDLQVVAASGSPTEMYIAWPPGWPDLNYFQSLGMNLAVPKNHPTANGFWETLSWENVDKYPADLILADSRGGGMQQILDFLPPTARSVPAVELGRITLWDAAAAFGYRNYARILRDHASTVAKARTDVDR